MTVRQGEKQSVIIPTDDNQLIVIDTFYTDGKLTYYGGPKIVHKSVKGVGRVTLMD